MGRPIPAPLPPGMAEIDALEQEQQLARIDVHVLLPRTRCHRQAKRAAFQPLVHHHIAGAIPREQFDPITSRDFYSMGAFFADIEEAIIGKREDGFLVPSDEQRQKLEAVLALTRTGRRRCRT